MREFDAFISYRHVYPDIQVAKQLHKMLESFKIPHPINDEAAYINWRIFMDSWELPVTADLYSSIQEALISSRFLIVICSKKTPESEWMATEVQSFTKLHGWNVILPILIEGTPEECFPKPLLAHGDTPYLDASGEGTVRRIMSSIRRRRAWIGSKLSGCDYDRLDAAIKKSDTKRFAFSAVGAALFLSVFSIISLNLWQAALTSRNESVRLEQEALNSEEEFLKSEQALGENLDAIALAAQNKAINEVYTRLAEAEAELANQNAYPAIGYAQELLKEPGLPEEIYADCLALIEEAQPTGLLSPIFTKQIRGARSAFTHDGKILLLAAGNGILESYPTDTFIKQASVQFSPLAGSNIQISSSDQHVGFTVYNERNTVYLVNPTTLEIQFQVDGHSGDENLDSFGYGFLPNSDTFYYYTPHGSLNFIKDLAVTKDTTFPIFPEYMDLYVLSDYQYLLYVESSRDGFDIPPQQAAIYDVESGEQTILPWRMYTEFKICHSPDKRFVAVQNHYEPDVLGEEGQWEAAYVTLLIDAVSGEILFSHTENEPKWGMAFSSDSNLFAFSSGAHTKIIDTHSFDTVATLNLSNAHFGSLAFLHDDATLAYSVFGDSSDYDIHLMDWKNRRQLGRFKGHTREIEKLMPSQDGSMLYSFSWNEVYVWNVSKHPTLDSSN